MTSFTHALTDPQVAIRFCDQMKRQQKHEKVE
jgi:hypothetical protein